MKGAIIFALFVCAAVANYKQEFNTIPVTIRDFWPCKNAGGSVGDDQCQTNFPNTCVPVAGCGGKTNTSNVQCGQCHPDFEMDSGVGTKGLVLPTLDANSKPQFNPAMTFPGKQQTISNNGKLFWSWFNSNATTYGLNMETQISLTLDNYVCPPPPGKNGQSASDYSRAGDCPSGGAVFGYSNFNEYPLDNMLFGTYGSSGHNYHFCMEIHLRFTYQGYEEFYFTGDDDVWVFINNQLAVDLGGIHTAQTARLLLNQTANLNLVVNQNYPFDMFYCERHTTASDMSLFTDLNLACPIYDWCGVCQGNGQSCCTCNDNNGCTTDTCDPYNGTCIYTPVVCPDLGDACNPNTCKTNTPTTYQCTQERLICNDNNACTLDRCNTKTGCQFLDNSTNCDRENSCESWTCDKSAGCKYVELEIDACTGTTCTSGTPQPVTPCPTTNFCTPLSCFNSTCAYLRNVSCDDLNPCTTDYCDPANGNCTNTPINCDDNNACTADSCVNGTCVHIQKDCSDGNACTIDLCTNSTGECYYTNVTIPDITNCNVSYCDKTFGIVSTPYICTPKDKCRCNNNKCECTNFLASTGFKIGAGVLAAIIIGAVVAAVLFAIGAKKGYDFHQARTMNASNVNTNPLYQDKGGSGENPFYQENNV